MTVEEISRLQIPFAGVGCIVHRAGRFLLVRHHDGRWGPPGGHLDFGESIEDCARRETLEETGVRVTNPEFVAVTNDLLAGGEKHYVTVWMRAEADETASITQEQAEIAAVGWFAPDSLPAPLFPYFENLLAGRSLPSCPTNLGFHAGQHAAN